jgi:hypothetical protein
VLLIDKCSSTCVPRNASVRMEIGVEIGEEIREEIGEMFGEARRVKREREIGEG